MICVFWPPARIEGVFKHLYSHEESIEYMNILYEYITAEYITEAGRYGKLRFS